MKPVSKVIYLISPYTHDDKAIVTQRYHDVSRKAAELVSAGHVVFSPITYGHTLLAYKHMPGDYEFWMNFCESFLRKCDEVLVYKMEGWEISKGCTAEIALATSLGLPVNYVEHEINITEY